jgi:uncharacterized integral membrane protein (TIGR00697 family)
MITNELIFILHIISVAGITLGALALGPTALTSIICLFGILANLFVTKQITLFGLHVVSTDVFMVGCILGLNLLQEHYGKKAANKAIITSMIMMLTYLAMALIHLLYTPNTFDTSHPHFQTLLTPMPRIIIASLIVYFSVQLTDSQLYQALQKMFQGKKLVLRNMISMVTTQFLDTVMFTFLGLYGTVHSVVHVILVSYAIKLLIIACNAPFISLSKLIIPSDNKPHDKF